MEQATDYRYQLAVWLFIGSEAIFFAALILSYAYYQTYHITGPTSRTSLDPVRTGAFTIALLASSATVWLAERSLRKQKAGGVRAWLAVSVILGGVFLFGQGSEYLRLFREQVTISRNLFGTTFFTLTGFHGLHVLAGLVALAILAGLALAGSFRGPRSAAIEATAIYWHFVDAVWIIIFSIVYLRVVP